MKPLSLLTFFAAAKKVSAAPHRGNANRPLTQQGKAKRPTQTDHEQSKERPKDQKGNAKPNHKPSKAPPKFQINKKKRREDPSQPGRQKKPRQKHQIQRTLRNCSLAEGQTPIGEPIMAKGQMRSNREVKKPKQAKKPTPATTPSGAPPIRVAPSSSAAQKKN
ncbi:hypothetical protein [Paraburkholderia fungorum]|uniref:Secreted protein n=1 Tax=Paraburkholderia fungorum TaxID=134537 RepID=A0AAW3V854_9BURK|nr:hypothetical protein [Paraburkholderia fungorum]MBB4517936.1 hypothetical protein [Paraburkholderia fungorum]MBB6205905.1 hypothetical protein [Paraburkholderia fungorum]